MNWISRRPRVETLEDRRVLASFTNPGAITINDDAVADPYPSTINVSGLTGNVIDVNVHIEDFRHGWPEDVQIGLVDPSAKRTLLMASNGAGVSVSNIDLTFDDSADSELPDGAQLTSGVYRPSAGSDGFIQFPPPAPATDYSTRLLVHNGVPGNGEWSLFVYDNDAAWAGAIDGGWSLDIVTDVFVGDAGDNEFTVRRNAPDSTLIDVIVDGVTTTVPTATITELTINGGAGDDTLTVDLSNGGIPVDIYFNGQANGAPSPGDQILIVDSNEQEQSLEFTYENETDGRIHVTELSATPLTVDYSGVETNALAFAPRELEMFLSDTAETITVDQVGAAMTRVDSTAGATTVFPNPRNPVEIVTGEGTDVVNVEGGDFGEGLFINSGLAGDDTINFNNGPTIGNYILVNALVTNISQPLIADDSVHIDGDTTNLGADVTAKGHSYGGQTILTADVVLHADTKLTILKLDGEFDFSVEGHPRLGLFVGDIGSTTPLESVAFNANTIVFGDITTKGHQTHNGVIFLEGAAGEALGFEERETQTFTSLEGNLDFAGRIIVNPAFGTSNLVTHSAGTTTFRGSVGGGVDASDLNPLSLTSTMAGPFTAEVDFTTIGDLTFNVTDSAEDTDDLTVGEAAVLTSTTGDVVFNVGDAVEVQAGTSINAPTGDVIVNIDPVATDADVGTGATAVIAGTITAANTYLNGGDDPDEFTPTPQLTTMFHVDGGAPVAPVLPGDILNLSMPNELNIFSDKIGNVSLTSSIGGIATPPIDFTSIETLNAESGNGVVNLFGDNNDPGVSQPDRFVVVGRDVDSHRGGDIDGANELSLEINGNAPIAVADVSFLNVFGDDQTRVDDPAVDTLNITPYADNTPQGWGIDVSFDEGLPIGTDGNEVDLIVYNTVAAPISEDIVIRPSGPDNGELLVVNGAFGTPIFHMDYVGNTDFRIIDSDGFVSDTDTLRLLGTDGSTIQTSGNDTVIADLTAAGTVVDPLITVLDSDDNDILYRVRNVVNLPRVNFELLDGDDTVTLTSAADYVVDVDVGRGDDEIDASSTTAADAPVTLRGGEGNDLLIGTDPAINTASIDVLIGGPGDDRLEGRGGRDRLFGGEDSDTIVADTDDGRDFVRGGEGTDVLLFFGDDADDDFTLFRNDDSTVVAVGGSTLLDVDAIEDIALFGDDGADSFEINDLYSSDVRNVTTVLGPGADADSVVVDGRTVADDLMIASGGGNGGATIIRGLTYDVFITEEDAAENDTLTIHGHEGDDTIKAATGIESRIDIVLNGDEGDDFLSADAILNGGSGDDFLVGGLGDDTINGNAGEDTMIGGDGQDTYDGGPGFDTIQISGTSAADDIDVRQLNETTLLYLVRDEFGNVIEDATTGSNTEDTIANVEQAKVLAGEGSDTIFFSIRDELFDDPGASLRMAVEGGDDAGSDRLGVLDHSDPDFNALPDLSILRQNHDITSGTVEVGPANAEPFLHVFSGIEFVQVVSDFPSTGQLFNVESPGLPNRLVVFKHDASEHNNDRNNATHLGANTTVNLDPNIDPGPGLLGLPADTDWYRVEALESGTIDFQVDFEQVASVGARPGLPGNGDLNVNAFDSDGQPIAGFTTSDDNDDNERVRIPAVQGELYYFQVEGDGNAINAYDVTAINLPPAIPFDLELVDNPTDGTTNPPGGSSNSDTGRSQFDNHTYDTTPTVVFRLDDGLLLNDLPGNDVPGNPLGDDEITIPFRGGPLQPNQPGYAIAVFDEGATAPAAGNDGGLTVRQPLGFAAQIEPGLYQFTVPGANELDEGSHFLTARVQMIDPADPRQTGFGDRSQSLEIVVDVTPPPVIFGLQFDATDGLHPDSDSGDASDPDTFIDRITHDETPTFFGRAEANSIVRLYLDLDGDDVLDNDDLLIGQTTAIPLDGTEQLETPAGPNEPGGQWEITSTVNMNDPFVLAELGLVKDGLRTILLSAEDLAGNTTAPDQNETLDIFVDTQGPQVTEVFITDREDFNLFTLKPETAEPTPRVDSLTVAVRDLPARILAFQYDAVSNVPPLAPIVLVGDHSGPIAVDNLFYNSINDGPGIALGEIVLEFNEPLPDDRFTLTLQDNVIDPAGNRLDGENNAAEPLDPFFPTGDEIPGGDFIARFTVDSRPEVAVWSQGVVYADINGNFVWDPEGQDNDFTNRDFVYNFGEITDAYFVGNFAQGAASSGFDKMGAYGRFNGVYQFLLDTDDDGVGDIVPSMFYQLNAIPVAGNFSGPEGDSVPAGVRPRDEIGAYDGNNWYLDVNGNNQIENGEQFPTNMLGVPFVGDFNGDGFDDLATFNNQSGDFQFDLNRDGNSDNTINFGFSGFAEKPIAGDFNLDGIDDIGLWVPGQEGQLPKESGEFHFLLSDNDPIGGPQANPVTNIGPSAIFNPFSPAPLGNDLISFFGDEFALPLWGNFDPPVGSESGGATFVGSLTNQENPLDVNHDGNVSGLDALIVINALGRPNLTDFSHPLRVVASLGGYQMDTSQDGTISSGDALVVINALGQQPPIEAEAEQVNWADSVAAAFADNDDDEDELLDILADDQNRQTF